MNNAKIATLQMPKTGYTLKSLTEDLTNAIDQSIIDTYTDKDGNFTVNGVRSNIRTNNLHQSIIEIIRSLVGNSNKFTFKLEEKIQDCYGKKRGLKVDIAMYKDNILHTVILVKGVNGDYNRNKFNYGGNLLHDAARILAPRLDGTPSPHSTVNVLFLNIIPTIGADYDEAKTLLRYQRIDVLNTKHLVEWSSNNKATVIDIVYENLINNFDANKAKSTKRKGSLKQTADGCCLTTKELFYREYSRHLVSDRMAINDHEANKLLQYVVECILN